MFIYIAQAMRKDSVLKITLMEKRIDETVMKRIQLVESKLVSLQ